jgi:protein SCO1/2
MRTWFQSVSLFLFVLLILFNARSASAGDARVFLARGVVEKIQPEDLEVVIKHEAVSNYMDAMTMPFKVKNQNELAGLRRGDEINFQLHVTAHASWVDHLSKTGFVKLPAPPTNSVAAIHAEKFELLHYKFTNELGQAVSLSDFPGQALAITFFYTRCPLPDYCPRLSKNFQEASQKLEAMTNAPTNWHFLSISFDPEFDSPAVLKVYGRFYQNDPAHWSFLTGPKDKIHELAAGAGVTVQDSNGIINHNFRTLIIDASGHLQTVFPMTGDLSGMIVDQIIKAAAVTNATSRRSQIH